MEKETMGNLNQKNKSANGTMRDVRILRSKEKGVALNLSSVTLFFCRGDGLPATFGTLQVLAAGPLQVGQFRSGGTGFGSGRPPGIRYTPSLL